MDYTTLQTAIGPLLLAGQAGRLNLISFATAQQPHEPQPDWRRDDTAFADAKRQLTEYFAGERRGFDLSLEPSGTPFQCDVLAALQRIPYGETRSYSDIAAAIGRPKAVRAVGAANARNPLPIVLPCHRVIGKGGGLTGFGGGLEVKEQLLELERRHSAS